MCSHKKNALYNVLLLLYIYIVDRQVGRWSAWKCINQTRFQTCNSDKSKITLLAIQLQMKQMVEYLAKTWNYFQNCLLCKYISISKILKLLDVIMYNTRIILYIRILLDLYEHIIGNTFEKCTITGTQRKPIYTLYAILIVTTITNSRNKKVSINK